MEIEECLSRFGFNVEHLDLMNGHAVGSNEVLYYEHQLLRRYFGQVLEVMNELQSAYLQQI